MISEVERRILHDCFDKYERDLSPVDVALYLTIHQIFPDEVLDIIEKQATRLSSLFRLRLEYARCSSSLSPLIDYFTQNAQQHIAEEIGRSLEEMKDDDDYLPTCSVTSAEYAQACMRLTIGQVPHVVGIVDRVALFDKLAALLINNRKHDEFFVVLHGMAGSGKSAAAAATLRLREQLTTRYYKYVYWIEDSSKDKEDLIDVALTLYASLQDSVDFETNPPRSLPYLTKKISTLLRDRPHTLLVVDNVIRPAAVRWLNQLHCRILITTRNCAIFDETSQNIDVIEVDGFTREEIESLIPFGSQEQISRLHTLSDGHSAVLAMIRKMVDKNADRLEEHLNFMERNGCLQLKLRSSQKNPIREAFLDQLKSITPSLFFSLECAAFFPSNLAIPSEVWTILIPVDVEDHGDVLLEVRSVLRELHELGWLRKKQTEADLKDCYEIPAIVSLFVSSVTAAEVAKAITLSLEQKLSRIFDEKQENDEDAQFERARSFILQHASQFRSLHDSHVNLYNNK